MRGLVTAAPRTGRTWQRPEPRPRQPDSPAAIPPHAGGAEMVEAHSADHGASDAVGSRMLWRQILTALQPCCTAFGVVNGAEHPIGHPEQPAVYPSLSCAITARLVGVVAFQTVTSASCRRGPAGVLFEPGLVRSFCGPLTTILQIISLTFAPGEPARWNRRGVSSECTNWTQPLRRPRLMYWMTKPADSGWSGVPRSCASAVSPMYSTHSPFSSCRCALPAD
jgi:hypothetical protein